MVSGESKKKRPQKGGPASSDQSARSPATEQASASPKRRQGAFGRWYRAKRPVVLFVGLFALLMGIFYALTFLPVINMKAIPAYTRLNAQTAAAMLNVFGEQARADGTMVTSKRFSVDIRHGCDAIDPSALFVAAVLAFPAGLRSKFPGAIVGVIALGVINLIRIVTLFYTGIHFPRAFQAMHVDVWQPVFILLALVFWVVWAWWATRSRTPQSDVATEKG